MTIETSYMVLFKKLYVLYEIKNNLCIVTKVVHQGLSKTKIDVSKHEAIYFALPCLIDGDLTLPSAELLRLP